MSTRRRISVDLSTAEAVSSMHSTMDRLNDLWDSICMEENQRKSRVDTFYRHIRSLLNEMVESETEMVRGIHQSIDLWIPRINCLRNEMRLTDFDISRFKAGSVSLFRELDKERERLHSLKNNRLEGQRELLVEAKSLCSRLGMDFREELPEGSESKIWEDEELQRFQNLVADANAELSERMEKLSQWQADMQRWHKQMNKKTHLDESGETLMEIDLNADVVLSDKFMSAMAETHYTGQLEYREWIEMAQFLYSEAIVKLFALWEACHMNSSKKYTMEFNPEIHTWADIKNLQNEITKLENYMEKRTEVYRRIKEWKSLWEEKVAFEDTANDVSRYHNRGGKLQTALTRQKWISTRIPQLHREIDEENEKYDKENPCDPIVIDGVLPNEYINGIIAERAARKENERLRKLRISGTIQKQLRPNQTMNITQTPRKHCLPCGFATPAKPVKCARIDSTVNRIYGVGGTPVRKLGAAFPSTSSLNSAITPVRPKANGPKTSSPKEVVSAASKLKNT